MMDIQRNIHSSSLHGGDSRWAQPQNTDQPAAVQFPQASWHTDPQNIAVHDDLVSPHSRTHSSRPSEGSHPPFPLPNDDGNEMLPVVVCKIDGCNATLRGYEDWVAHVRAPYGHSMVQSKDKTRVRCPWDICAIVRGRSALQDHLVLHGMINFECRFCQPRERRLASPAYMRKHLTRYHPDCDQAVHRSEYFREVPACKGRTFRIQLPLAT